MWVHVGRTGRAGAARLAAATCSTHGVAKVR
jgi:hypothetical protein